MSELGVIGCLYGRGVRRAIGLVSLLITALGMSGCASYRAGAGDRQLPGGYKDVAVPVFKNQTAEAGAEVYFTNAIVREFERSRIARVTDKDKAQVALEGTVESVKYLVANQMQQGKSSPAEMPDNTVITTEYRIVLTAAIRLRRISDQKVLWQGTFSGERSYLAPRVLQPSLNSVNAIYNHSAHYQNIESMAADLMAEAHNRMTENF
jgi:hypothetical protein